jgi:hypothetical protein
MNVFGEPTMSIGNYGSHSVPRQPTKPSADDRTDTRREEADERKENEAKYKENVDRLNRARDVEIESALSGRHRGQ